MSIEFVRERLSQRTTLQDLLRPIGLTEMVTVSGTSQASDGGRHAIHCALIPSIQIQQVLSNLSWDLHRGGGLPGSAGSGVNAEYFRFGDMDRIEPFVIDRWFHNRRDKYVEISEEFRLFHNPYHDRQQERYIKFDDNSDGTVVAVVQPELIKIRMKEIRQFLAIKEMHLSIQFECTAFSDKGLEELGDAERFQEGKTKLACWGLSYADAKPMALGKSTYSILYGKRLIEPLPKSKSGFLGFAEEPERYVDFIIGMDDNGDEIEHTCDPAALSNWFGKNPEAPHEVTPVSFRKEVLDKYYQQPSKYKVEDGTLWCNFAWYLRIDNHHEDKVCVLLKDLGLLPYQEQLHWRAHNIASEFGYSEVAWRRNFENEWVDSDQPDHIFQQRYRHLAQVCEGNLGWQLLIPLAEGDQYHLQNIRVPSTDEQQDFDGLVLGLATLIPDSLNVAELKSLLQPCRHKDQKGNQKRGIQLLDTLLTACRVDDPTTHIDFLRNLQNLRSSGSAHRKGREYRKVAARFGVEDQDLRTVFANILWKAAALLNYLIELVVERRVFAVV